MSEKLSAQTLVDGLAAAVAFTYPTKADRIAGTNRTPSTIAVSIDKVCREVDTGDIYIWDGAAWRPVSAGGYGVCLVTSNSITPFTTISAALALASSGDMVTLGPGTYAESVTIPAGVVLRSAGGDSLAKITGAAATGTRITVGDGATVDGVEVLLPTDAVPAIACSTATLATVRRISLIGAGASGIGVKMTGSGALFVDRLQYLSGTCHALVQQTAGVVESNEVFVFSGTLDRPAEILGGAFYFVNFSMSASVTSTQGIHVEAATVDGQVGIIRGGVSIHIANNAANVRLRNVTLEGSTWDLLIDPALTSGTCYLLSVVAIESKFSQPPAWIGGADFMYLLLDSTSGDLSMRLNAELHLGIAEVGRELSVGRGDSTQREMVVITSDSTATSTTEGGNLTDVSAAARSTSGSTFGFQGTAANHTIMVCLNLLDAFTLAKLKHWGWKIKQTTASTTDGVYAFELWDGAAWTSFGVMASHASEFYRYANSVFWRPNSDEHIRFGIDTETTWATKTINSVTGYWVRVRITTPPTTAPVFEQFKCSVPRLEVNENGTITAHGLAMWRQTLLATGNVFGESGGVLDASVSVGSGGLPTGWLHVLKNSQLNGNGDAIYMQFAIPKGLCTAFTLRFDVTYSIIGVGTDPPTMILSVLPQEVSGVPVASGTSLVPVARSEANTDALTAIASQSDTFVVPEVSAGKLHLSQRNGIDVSNYYEGDMVMVRLEMDDDGLDNLDMVIWSIAVSGVSWTSGEVL